MGALRLFFVLCTKAINNYNVTVSTHKVNIYNTGISFAKERRWQKGAAFQVAF
jgi:hypothetical protein